MPFLPTSDLPIAELATAPVDGASYVAEAETAEGALSAVHAELGPDARIVEARRVLRGGIGGFFAKELVQIHAAPRGPAPLPSDGAAPVEVTDPTPPLEGSPVDRLLADVADLDEVPSTLDFSTFLRRQLEQSVAGAARSVDPAPEVRPTREDGLAPAASTSPLLVHWPQATAPATAGVRSPAPASAATLVGPGANEESHERPVADDAAADPTIVTGPPAATDGGPAWSATALLRVGLPRQLVESLDVDDPADDVAWTFALASALRPLCRPLPTGDSVLVGPRAKSQARHRQLPLVEVGSSVRAEGHVAAAVGRGVAGRAWLRGASAGRWWHVLVGGVGWRRLLGDDVLAVSWASVDDLPDALSCAVEFGLVLGSGPLTGSVVRARPLEVALAVRALVADR